MKKNPTTLCLIALAASMSANAFVIEWDRIRHWAGEGDNKVALVVQFADSGEAKAYVWGYCWADDAHQPSGEEVFRAIASESDDLYLFTQYTGWMGNTVCGIGYSPHNSIADHIIYDFSTALEDPNISFNWFSANTALGQSSVPGWDTPDLCEAAIEEAKTTNILEHPINARVYGYACYDYDHWLKYDGDEKMRWHAGWYKGYWSYWVGGADSETLSYSGLGYTSRKLTDGSVDAWKYSFLDGPVDGSDFDGTTGASEGWHELDYDHFVSTDNISITSAESIEDYRIYTLRGVSVKDYRSLTPGIYILVKNGEAKKIQIH